MIKSITHKTALCLVPPENVWEQIQSIRSVYDKAYPRWMPHINLVYPFVDESDFIAVKTQLEPFLNVRAPFEIEFDQTSFEYFVQKADQCTFHVRPKLTQDVVDLQRIIESALPAHFKSIRQFQAHLTLGQTTKSRISDIMIEMKAKWKPIKFRVDRVSMISRENDPEDLFSIKNQILLVGQKPILYSEEPAPTIETPPIMNIKPITLTKTSLCIIPPTEFSHRLLHLFEDTSFQPLRPFRLILGEYDVIPDESKLSTQILSVPKFTLDFGARSICFNYSTSRLFLKPNVTEFIERLKMNDKDFDGTLTLGILDKKDLTEVGNRFTDNWTLSTHEFEIDRVHLIDSNGRFQNSFPLKSQCFS